MKVKMDCRNCMKGMRRGKDIFHGFSVSCWKCPSCNEIVYNEKEVQPILKYNTLAQAGGYLTATVGTLGNSKILRIPKLAEQIFNIRKGAKLRFSLESGRICILAGKKS